MPSAAADRWKKAVAMGLSLFGRTFNPSKCKTSAKMAVARIKLLRNKREVVIRQIRRDIALLLESGQDATARIRVEHVIREQNIMAANELIELFCDLIVARLSIIAKQRECPPDLKEGISSLIFAGPRCSELPELLAIRDVFQKKYGKDFVSAATDLRPNAGVNRLLIEKLSVKTPSGEVKLKVLKEIAKEYQVQWDTTESEEELLKPPEERIEGPNGFVSASGMPLKPVQKPSLEPNDASNRGQQGNVMNFQDVASAAGVAAEKALAAAEAAAVLAAYGGNKQMPASHNSGGSFNNTSRKSSIKFKPTPPAEYSTIDDQSEDERTTIQTNGYEYYTHSGVENEQKVDDGRKVIRRQSYNCQRAPTGTKFDEESDCDEEIEMEEPPSANAGRINRRHSYNNAPPPAHSGVKYDEYSDDEEDEEVSDDEFRQPARGTADRPPERPAPQIPARRVHPKLPDYDTLAARFEALKQHKAQPR
ncbi:IST1-like protein [Salvia hispanica]|uniref:IST1-like protein n=1 Tax=Salvia hispanica TaxID=49212 RepID=UPI00200908BA|nr:IST1-like protein [Salvia hispanica]